MKIVPTDFEQKILADTLVARPKGRVEPAERRKKIEAIKHHYVSINLFYKDSRCEVCGKYKESIRHI